MLKNASQECLPTVNVVSPDITTPNPSTSSAIKISKNTEENPDDPTPADAVDIQMEHSSNQLHSQSTEAEAKNYLYTLKSV